MEDSGYNSLMIGVYIFIFLLATSLTVYLFSTTVTVADKAYEYGKVTTGDSVIETTSAPKYSIITGAELLTYYYNYKSPDKYGTTNTPNYDFSNINDVGIDINRSYALIYSTANTGSKPVITVKDITSEVGTPAAGEIIPINNQPSDPTVITFPNTDVKITPNTIVEFEAHSYVNVSFATNTITKYYWRIDYSPEDGRPDFTATTSGQTGELTYMLHGNALKFTDGANKVYVTSEDAFGNKSNTISNDVIVGYNDPVINFVKEMDNKVVNNGGVNIDTPTGASLRFIADATSKNPGGFIQKYDWTLNGVLVQSGASDRFLKNFVPGQYTLGLKVHDSIKGSAETTFVFTVKNIPAPTLTCSNTAITTNRTLAITDPTINLTFNAALDAKYSIVKYVWNVDGAVYETNELTGINLNYGIGSHTVTVHGVNSQGIISDTTTLTFTITQDFVPYEKEFTSNDIVTLPAGRYVFETWGAQGGNGAGGNGGYSKGEINLTESKTFQVYVGTSAGYNGGGNSRLSYSAGGGATDIRSGDATSTYRTYYNISFANGGLHDDPGAQHFHGPYERLRKGIYQVDVYGSNLNYIGEVWACTDIGATRFEVRNLVRTNTHISYYVVVPNDDDLMELNVLQYNPSTKAYISITNVTASRLDDRIIVAGGGAGNGGNNINCFGGSAGGLTGFTGGRVCGAPGTGGTQTSGGIAGRLNYYGATNGSFGIGGNAETASNTSAGAGGGGYYGGGGASSDYSGWNDLDDSGGGGGSSFISGYSGCNAVNISGVHTGQPNHYSGLVFINGFMSNGSNTGNGKAKITRIRTTGTNPNLVANITLSNEYFNGSTSYSQAGQMENNFTITFDATPTTTTNMPNQGEYAYYSSGVKTYNYVVTDIHGGNLPVAGMGISLGTNGIVMIAHSDNYYYTLLSYPANLSAKHAYKVVVNNKIPSLYVDGTLVRTGVTPVNCSTLISRPSVGAGGYGNYVGYANNFNFYNIAM